MTVIDNNPKVYFEKQRLKFTKSLHEVKHKIRRISFARIIVFLITAVGIYIAVANRQDVIAIAFTSGIGLFIYLVKVHASLEKKTMERNSR